jgi:hypothetical protein
MAEMVGCENHVDCIPNIPVRIPDNMFRPARSVTFAALFVASCASAPVRHSTPTPPPGSGPDPTPFSTATALDALPPGWRPYRLMRLKNLTEYRLTPVEGGGIAMMAIADSSASGLQYDTVVDPKEYPYLSWSWKVPGNMAASNNTLARLEDSPARVIVTFEGGRDQLSDGEQINYDLAVALTGNELPYATIMYVCDSQLPVGAIIPHHFSRRVQMVVTGSGREKSGRWERETVNLLEDYRRIFGEDPPRVISVGIMSDSDNTGTRTIAYYGDIRFHRQLPPDSSASR